MLIRVYRNEGQVADDVDRALTATVEELSKVSGIPLVRLVEAALISYMLEWREHGYVPIHGGE